MMTKQSSDERTAAQTGRRSVISGLEQRVLRRARRLDIPTGGVVIVGFSGGSDSLCLAALLRRVASKLGLWPLLVHVDHKLRETSEADARNAAALANELRLPFECVTLPEGLRDLHPHVGLEEAARRERYRALVDAAVRSGSRVIATGHHQRDQAETVLLHLFRGAGSAGAAGMAPLRPIAMAWWESGAPATVLQLWRPLLDERKPAIEAYLAELGLQPILDESNASADFTRNVMRHRVLPAIEADFPHAATAIAQFADIARVESELIDGLAAAALGDARGTDDSLHLGGFNGLHLAVRRRVLLRWLRERTGTSEIPFERVEAVLALAASGAEGAIVEVAEGRSATILRDRLICATRGDLLDLAWSAFAGPRVDPSALPAALAADSRVVLGLHAFQCERGRVADAGQRERSATIPATDGEVIIRLLNPRDLWAGGPRQVRDSLRSARVPALIRSDIVCVAGRDGVLWVPGVPLPLTSAQVRAYDAVTVSWSVVD